MTKIYEMGELQLDAEALVLTHEGVPTPLGPRGVAVLAVLVSRANEYVSKAVIMDTAWPGLVVEDGNLTVQISLIRRALALAPGGAKWIETLARRGYRFVGPVEEVGRGSAAPAAKRIRSKHNLPNQLTSFVGRAQEIADLEELLTANRLVTLTGTGGAGKTRLAIQVASRFIDAFPDGAWMVELAALSDPRLVPQAVAQTLDVKEQPTRPVIETLIDHLASKKLLLVLDNVEHLLEACAHLVGEIVRRTSNITVLTTSRDRLGMTGELTYRVPSLTVPDTSETMTPETALRYEAVRLFVERTKLVRPHFGVTTENAASLASLCYRLDGIPLAIELAAPRLRSMSVEELSQRLDRCFALLTTGSRAAPSRHRTLRSTIDWSYDLLPEREQAMLRRVAVFAGGWTLASAEQICAGDGIDALDVLGHLTSLVDRSLLVTDEQASATRYRILETVRQYALDHLRERAEEARWRRSHLDCFLALAAEFNKEINGPNQQAWLAKIVSEHDNLRAALAWSVEASPTEGLGLAAALDAFWRIRGYLAEGREWLARLLNAVPIDLPTRERARGLYAAAVLAILQGDYAAGKRLLQDSLALFRAIDYPTGAARALDGLAYLSIEQGDYSEAEALAREAIDRARATGDRTLLYSNLGHLAYALHAQGQWTAARKLYEQALDVARELGTPFEIGHALREVGRAECDEGLHDLALKHLTEGMTILHGLGNRPGVIESLEGLAGLAAVTASTRRATRLWGAADVLRREIGNARSVHQTAAYERQLKAVREILSAEAFDQAWDEGRAMTLDDAVRYALGSTAGNDV